MQYIYQLEPLASINSRLAPADAFSSTAQVIRAADSDLRELHSH
jgi:hypothetical protein